MIRRKNSGTPPSAVKSRSWFVAAAVAGGVLSGAATLSPSALAAAHQTDTSAPVAAMSRMDDLSSDGFGGDFGHFKPCRHHKCHHHKCRHHKCCHHCVVKCRRCHGATGPTGPTGPRGATGPTGPAGTGALGVDTAVQGTSKFIGLVRPDGHTLVRDPNTVPPWHDISTLPGYPAGVTDVSLAVMGSTLHVTVRAGDAVYQTACTVSPTPGTGGNPAWPGNCTVFTNLTPPLFRAQR